MSAKDYLAFRPALQPVLSLAMQLVLRDRARDLPLDDVVASAREVFARPSTFAELRKLLAASFPHVDGRAMGYTVRTHLPLVSVPDGTTWGYRADANFVLAEEWIGKALSRKQETEALVLRYLKAFGPATAADVQSWSGLQVQPVLETLRPKLLVERDERRREWFDIRDAPRPDEETPAPPRFIAAFDNLVLSHADRSRIVPEEYRPRIVTKNLQVRPTFLVDGFVAGTWETKAARNTASLTISPFDRLERGVKTQLIEEAEKLVPFMEPEAASFEVRLA
jgi:hypothetical protein